MNRALIVAWHRYGPLDTDFKGYRVMWENWLRMLPIWASEVDHLYLIDSDLNVTEEDKKILEKNFKEVTILKRELEGHHWVQFHWVIPQVKEENMFFLDNDVIIKKKGLVDSWFKMLEKGADFVGNFDGSGGMVDVIQEKYPIMKTLGHRMGTYYFLIKKSLLEKISTYTFEPNYFEVGTYIPELNYYTKEGDWMDSFGWFTLKMLANGAKIETIADPRDSIYLQEKDGDWVISREPEEPVDLGYYHIRNGNLANYVLSSRLSHPSDYQREINGAKRELLRSLAWFDWMDWKLGTNYTTEVALMLGDMKVALEKWEMYMKKFVKYHNL